MQRTIGRDQKVYSSGMLRLCEDDAALQNNTAGQQTLKTGVQDLTSFHNAGCGRQIYLKFESYNLQSKTCFIKVLIFTARCYASAVLAMGLCLSVCVCPSVSVTSRSSTKTAKRRITQTTLHYSPGSLVF